MVSGWGGPKRLGATACRMQPPPSHHSSQGGAGSHALLVLAGPCLLSRPALPLARQSTCCATLPPAHYLSRSRALCAPAGHPGRPSGAAGRRPARLCAQGAGCVVARRDLPASHRGSPAEAVQRPAGGSAPGRRRGRQQRRRRCWRGSRARTRHGGISHRRGRCSGTAAAATAVFHVSWQHVWAGGRSCCGVQPRPGARASCCSAGLPSQQGRGVQHPRAACCGRLSQQPATSGRCSQSAAAHGRQQQPAAAATEHRGV